MNTAKVYAIPTFLFIGLLFNALLLNTTAEAADWLFYQGPCSEFPDCNKNCISKGFPMGGKCVPPAPGKTHACYCVST
ncbi:Defensin-like protein [Actinidia chinensis var. chinensis]|uniref:Defensin-like protein n=1 Tax=Actinidia chinensis var. chinensis TaxID=1590841 RepID=A0A2R6PE78_ACTCC|nr:Defensin-like protein [Actinidia chinensis var. chinensis]